MIIEYLLSAVAAAGIAIIVVLLIVGFFISSAFMLLAAKIVKVQNATYGRAMLATFLGGLAGSAVSIPLSFLGVPGAILGAIGGFFLESLVVKAIFATSYGKGLLTTLLAGVLAAAVAVVIVLIVLGASFLSCAR
jgi:hypothetical protein